MIDLIQKSVYFILLFAVPAYSKHMFSALWAHFQVPILSVKYSSATFQPETLMRVWNTKQISLRIFKGAE